MRLSNSAASGPRTSSPPRVETSISPTPSRTAVASSWTHRSFSSGAP